MFRIEGVITAMPTNVTPEYRKAEQAYRSARDPSDRLDCLREMLRTIPKHKGTEHVQADIKSRIKQLTDELAAPRKGGKRSGPTHSIRPAGAAQIALIGPPNAGKSSIHARLTGSHTDIAPYPFTTHAPEPGMLKYEDIQIQLVDLPAISTDFMEPWMPNSLERADAVLLVVDINDPACVEQIQIVLNRLAEKNIALSEHWPGLSEDDEHRHNPMAHQHDHEHDENGIAHEGDEDAEIENPFRLSLPTLLIANKCDLDPDPDELEILEELVDVNYPALRTSAETGEGLDELAPMLVQGLEIVRVYTKAPNGEVETGEPFTVRRGGTIHDVALLVHREIAANLRFARIWGTNVHPGQQAGSNHLVEDGDVVELHTK